MVNALSITTNIESLSSSLKRSAWISVFESLLVVVLGIFIVVEPDWTLKITSYIIGSLLSIRGLYLIISYLIEKGYKNFFNNNLLTGIIALILGIVFIFTGESLLSIFRLGLGAIIIYIALSRVNLGIKLHSAKIKTWYLPLLLSLISLGLGVFLLMNESSAILLVGWFMILSGLLGVISDICYIQNLSQVTKFLEQSFQNHQ